MKINQQSTIEYIQSLRNINGSYLFSRDTKVANLYSTCFAVFASDLINILPKPNSIEHSYTINYIKSFQKKDSGLFFDNNVTQTNFKTHSLEYIEWQLTDFSLMALQSLKNKPDYQFEFLNKYKSKEYLKKWLRELNWNNPWYVSNLIMFILNFFIYENEKLNIDNQRYINYIIGWLNDHQDLKNGFWNLGQKSTFHNQMAAAYHFIFFYTFLGKKIPHFDKIVNSTLAIQDYDGLYSYSGGGGSCDDFDAIDLLCRSTFYSNYKKEEIKLSLIKSYKALWQNQNIDGGFCWAKRDDFQLSKLIHAIDFSLWRRTSFLDFLANGKAKTLDQFEKILFNRHLYWRYSGLEKMKIKFSQSDIWSTWFRLLSIAFIEKTFPGISEQNQSFDWHFHPYCGLGFYR